jgi:aminodeoxychorismate lyase
MIVFFNGEFVRAEKPLVSIFDRCLCYGDGLFESVRISRGQPFRWRQHLIRLAQGAEVLGIKVPFSPAELSTTGAELVRRLGISDGVLRIQLSRGQSPRGYSPRDANQPWLAMSVHPLPAPKARGTPRWRLATSSYRVAAGDPLASIKTCNKLLQVLARREAQDKGGDEALLLNTRGHVVEASSANVFWVQSGGVCTPPTASGALDGITRGVVFELCKRLLIPCRQRNCRPDQLRKAEGVFLTLSSLGIVEAMSLDGAALRRSAITRRIRTEYDRLLRRESGALRSAAFTRSRGLAASPSGHTPA